MALHRRLIRFRTTALPTFFVTTMPTFGRSETRDRCANACTVSAGVDAALPRRIASVLTSDGQRITVGLTDESEPGTVIELFEENSAPFGAAKK